jgi:hypothetical protein
LKFGNFTHKQKQQKKLSQFFKDDNWIRYECTYMVLHSFCTNVEAIIRNSFSVIWWNQTIADPEVKFQVGRNFWSLLVNYTYEAMTVQCW